MRSLKIIAGLLVLALAAAVLFAWTLPADVGYRYGARWLGPVVLSGVSGTIWNGHADGVSVFGRDLGELDWHARKFPVLGGRFVADVRVTGADVEAAGEIARSAGSIDAHDVRFSLPAALLEPMLDLDGLHLAGTIGGVVAEVALAQGRLAAASGSARWTGAGVSGAAEARFSDILADFAMQPDGSIAGTVHDDGHGNLAVDGRFSARLAAFDVTADLRARNGDAQVVAALRHIGEPQADGSSKLVVHGPVLKLF